jgi:hypothetical protein
MRRKKRLRKIKVEGIPRNAIRLKIVDHSTLAVRAYELRGLVGNGIKTTTKGKRGKKLHDEATLAGPIMTVERS